jgi:hypothetical protein
LFLAKPQCCLILPDYFLVTMPYAPGGFFLGFFFDPEERGNMSPQNLGFSPRYMALQPRRSFSS